MTDPDVNIKWLERGLKRIEEAVRVLSIKIDLYNETFVSRADADKEHARFEAQIEKKEAEADKEYLRLEAQIKKKADASELRTIRTVVFGLVGAVLIAVLNAVLKLIGLTT